MKKIVLALSIALAASSLAAAQNKLTMKEAKDLIPRPLLDPVPSLDPVDKAAAVDTLETSDPRIVLVLRGDGTWEYVKDDNVVLKDDVFASDWNTHVVNPYNVKYEDLPMRITLWLADSASHFACPNQTKVFSPFGYRHGRQHQGVDLPYPTGTPVRVAFDGKVRYAARSGGYGNLIIVRHENGLETFYGHLSKILVQTGDRVHAGDTIALGGSTGRSSGPHLHFETRYKGFAFDPQWLIDFEKGELRQSAYVLRRKLLNPSSTYVPASEDDEETIYLTEEQERAEEERLAKERAAMRYHKIKSGDTLSGLAVKYHTTVSAICKLNGISAKSTLRIGQTIRVK